MSALTESAAWKALATHYTATRGLKMRDLFEADSGRFRELSLTFDDLLFDFSKNRVTGETIDLLVALAEQCQLPSYINRLFAGEKLNFTENRSVLHVALRNRKNTPIVVDGENVMPKVNAVLAKMRDFTESVRQGNWKGYTGKEIRHIVNVGIGGSDLGPVMATEALRPYWKKELSVHFVSNIDGTDVAEKLRRVDP